MEEVVGSSERALPSGFTRHQIFSGQSSYGQVGGDRFIPCRSAMDMGFAHAMLTESGKEKVSASSPYQKLLAEAMLQNRTRILAFKPKSLVAMDSFTQEACADHHFTQHAKPAKPRRHIPLSAERILYVPKILDDYNTNVLDWGSCNVLALAIDCNIYLWDASRGSYSARITLDGEILTSVSWAPDGRHLAIGLDSSDVLLYDTDLGKILRRLHGAHQSRVGSLCWNKHILTTGGTDGMVVNNDMRLRSHIVQTYRGHQKEVCGVKWSNSGRWLASGGGDNVVHIWDVSMAFRNNTQNQWLYRLEDHMAAVRALAWSPFHSNVLASGGGGTDRCIKFWDTHTGDCLNSVDTRSQVCALLWSKTEWELLSSHGFMKNQLTLRKYPSMEKMVELTGHRSSILFMAQSPDGCTVASMAGDKTLRFWNIFGTPKALKAANLGPFRAFTGRCYIR